jgi:hypothetical protein
MNKKAKKNLVLTRETLLRLDDRNLDPVVGGQTLDCSTLSRPVCSTCDNCGQ